MLQVELSSENPFIRDTQCTCKAGLGHCNHLLGLLYTLAQSLKMEHKSVPPRTSKTSLPQTWHVPSRTLGLKPKPISTVSVSKVKPPNSSTLRVNRTSEGILPNVYCPVPVPLPCGEFEENLRENLKASGSRSHMFKLLTASNQQKKLVTTEFGDLPLGSVLSYQLPQQTVSFEEHPTLPLPPQPCSYATVLNQEEHDFYGGLIITPEDSLHLESGTRDQSSITWHRLRAERITSTSFKRVCSRVKDFEKLAADMTAKQTIQTKAMKRGIQLEPVAAAEYEKLTGNKLFPCGLIINHHAPHLGASPDRKVVDLTADPVHGLLEIKCPNKDSFKNCSYLTNAAGNYTLKKTHEYYYQIVGQMGISGFTWCDFFVKCNSDYHLERIHFNKDEWEELKCKLDFFFFFSCFLPVLCNKRV